jgi:enoyl-CoA hydratase/carnithine racemase
MKCRFVQWEVRAVPGDDEARIGIITMNRPDRKNALGPRMAMELNHVFDVARHSETRVIVLTGAGGDFCSGGDLKEETLPLERPEDNMGLDSEMGELALWMMNDHFHHVAQSALHKLEALPQPVIAAMDGAAVGAGFEMAIACDLRVATERVRLSEIAIPAGFVSEWSCPRNLPKLVGLGLATELMLTGRFVDAKEALAVRLVNRVVAPEKLMDEAIGWANQIARLPRLGVRYGKELLKLYNSDNRSSQNYAHELERVLEITRSEDAAEGISALLSKRPPRWMR